MGFLHQSGISVIHNSFPFFEIFTTSTIVSRGRDGTYSYKALFEENPSKCEKPSFLFLFGDHGDVFDDDVIDWRVLHQPIFCHGIDLGDRAFLLGIEFLFVPLVA